MRDTSTGNGKVVVNRCMSLDGFTAGPGDAMDWVFDFVAPIESAFPEIMAATGAMLIGRRTYEVGKRMADGPHPPAYDGELSSSSPTTRRTRRTRRSRSSPVISGKPSPRHCAPRAARTSKSSAPTWPVSACGGDSWTRSWCMSCRSCSATAFASSRPRALPG